MRRDRALKLLAECTGNDIWSLEYCRDAGVPEDWLAELAEIYESGFQTDRETIYCEDRIVNQYHGVRDVHLAVKLGQLLGIDVLRITAGAQLPCDIVLAIQDAVLEEL